MTIDNFTFPLLSPNQAAARFIFCFIPFSPYLRDIDLYEENLKRLEELSIREITILAKLHQYKYNNEAFYEDIRKDCGIEKDEVKNILSAVTRTGFCKEKVGAYLGYEGDVYYTTPLFESFLKCIGVCAEETENS